MNIIFYIPNTSAEKEKVNIQVQSEIERIYKQNVLHVAGELDAKVTYTEVLRKT